MDELIATLENEDKEYEKLINYSKEKTVHIVKSDIEKLQEVTQMEQEIIEHISRLEKKRTEVIDDIAIVLNKDKGFLTITNLITMLVKQPDEQKRLAYIHDKLKNTLQSMKVINEQNKLLLNKSMEMLRFDFNLIKNLNQGPETADYNKTACNTGNILGNEIKRFDAKQ